MERYLARVCWNDCDWTRPCGHPAGSSYVKEHGFGYEEWLNCDAVRARGLRYAFIQGVSRSQERLQNTEIALDIFTISASRTPYLVARLEKARVLTREESLQVTRALRAGGVLKQMKREMTAVGLSSSASELDKELAMVNVSFEPGALTMLRPHEPLAHAKVRGRTRFQLYRAISLGAPTFKGNSNAKAEHGERQQQFAEAKQLLLLENRMQNELFDLLERQFGKGRVIREREHVDLTVMAPSGTPQWLIEVKSVGEPRLAVRAAIGQLLEYAHYPRQTRFSRSTKLVIAAPGVLDVACRDYLTALKAKYRFNVDYRHYEPGSRKFML